ncbi:hypothetical protein [Aeromonas molluscorum]|uniref:hypothetical protein n=1 Tax=Aeromonas molluscorum TaxID=271417 RepID=UPI003F1B82F8
MMKPQRYLIPLLLMTQSALAAETGGPLPPVPAPVRSQGLSFEQMSSSPGTLSLRVLLAGASRSRLKED